MKKRNFLLLVLIVPLFISCKKNTEVNGIKMIHVKGGKYEMGKTEEQIEDHEKKSTRTVSVKDFFISKYEITNEQYAKFLNEVNAQDDGSYEDKKLIDLSMSYCKIKYDNNRFVVDSNQKDLPVVGVNWFGAKAFCEHYNGRLPKEAEWEYAARGGTKAQKTKFSGSNNLDEVAWYKGNSDDHLHKPGSKKTNELGLYDMSGNVWEWSGNEYGEKNIANVPATDVTVGAIRIARGGSFKHEKMHNRVSSRFSSNYPEFSSDNLGFRFCKDAD